MSWSGSVDIAFAWLRSSKLDVMYLSSSLRLLCFPYTVVGVADHGKVDSGIRVRVDNEWVAMQRPVL